MEVQSIKSKFLKKMLHIQPAIDNNNISNNKHGWKIKKNKKQTKKQKTKNEHKKEDRITYSTIPRN